MDSLIRAVIPISLIIHAVLLILSLRTHPLRSGRSWLFLTLMLSALALTTLLFPPDLLLAGILGRGFVTVFMLAATLAAFGAVLIRDLTNRQPRLWLALAGVWLVALLATAFVSTPMVIGAQDWLFATVATPTLAGVMALGGLTGLSVYLLGSTFYAFYVAKLPEVANRALYWVIDAALVLIGVVLIMSMTDVLSFIGILILLMGMAGAAYAQASYRVFDIRSELAAALRTLVQIVVTAAVIYTAITLAQTINVDPERTVIVLVTLALGAALIYVPMRQLIESLLRRIIRSNTTDPTEATRRYSQEVSKAVELDQLVSVATRTLNQVMRVRRSGLTLVDSLSDTDQIELIVMMGGEIREIKGYVGASSPIYQQLSRSQTPITQFDIEFSPTYKALSATERGFFQDLHMSAYAPIIVDNTLIGVLVCGPKLNDAPFFPADLELLATMANQTGVALRNARLVADLRQLNQSMKSLNTGLEAAKEQMEKLDSVKTDFVTIASHELRTPLAQIRGYTDIIDALNESGMLDRDQINGLINNLRKATERMEELIAAMLDVSQLDVNAMDLRFAQASLESVTRMAIEPLTDAIKQRKLTLSARGLRGLPTLQADMQRLVQAFRNVVVNAIKFTPDGGRIEITASLRPAERPGAKDHILVAITDTGVGINKENLELVFQKFFRAYDPSLHSTGAHKFMGAGPGLGLTIAKGVIEGHGGKIWAESPGHSMETFPGTTFYILLPVNPPEDARRVLAFESQPAETTSAEPTLMRPQM